MSINKVRLTFVALLSVNEDHSKRLNKKVENTFGMRLNAIREFFHDLATNVEFSHFDSNSTPEFKFKVRNPLILEKEFQMARSISQKT